MLNLACAALSWAKKITLIALFFFLVIFTFRLLLLYCLVLKAG